MVLNQHEIAGLKIFMDAARGTGQEYPLATESSG